MKTEALAPQMPVAYPSLVKRVQSMGIDGLFMFVLMFAVGAVIDKTGYDAPGWMRAVLFFGIWFVYEPLAVSLGCTLGQYIMEIRVRDSENETKKINIVLSFLRFVFKVLLGWISFLTIHTNPQRRAIHDMVGHSVMIDIKKPESDDE
jgi:uncharacterized RDD family membrane protein YckC